MIKYMWLLSSGTSILQQEQVHRVKMVKKNTKTLGATSIVGIPTSMVDILTKILTSNVNRHGNICVNAKRHITEDGQR